MPTYEYRCRDCARKIEVQQSFADPPYEECEFCGGKLRRVFSPIGVLFKGSGFYSTDARSSAKKSEKQSANGEKRPDTAKTEAGSKAGDTKAPSGDSSPAAPKSRTAEKPAK